jgi:SAM-dependent methyltransferase
MRLKSKSSTCRLCHHKAVWFCDNFKKPIDFFRCIYCKSIFKEKDNFLDHNAEKTRYETHNNDVKDIRYQKFVSPITDAVFDEFSNDALGLDYGCGTGPVASYILEKKGFKMTLFDPFFYTETSYSQKKYNFIICCEVMEHFHQPDKEFKHLKELLSKNGVLYCKTKMISDNISVDAFKAWHYKDDPTHVFFYTPTALNFIQTNEGFQSVSFDEKLIIFKA